MTANYFRFELQGDYTQNMLKIPEWSMARYNRDGNWAGGRLLNGTDFDASGNTVTGAQFEKLAGKTYYCSEDQGQGRRPQARRLGPGRLHDSDTAADRWLQQGKGAVADRRPDHRLGHQPAVEGLVHRWPHLVRRWSVDELPHVGKPRRKVGNDYLSGNQYSAWDLTGTPSATFSPDLQQQLMNGIAEVDTGSTDSSWKRTEVKQNYFQADVTKLFESGWLDSIQFGAKYRDGKVHRNTGNTYWCAPAVTRPTMTTAATRVAAIRLPAMRSPASSCPIRSATLPVASMPTCSRASTTRRTSTI